MKYVILCICLALSSSPIFSQADSDRWIEHTIDSKVFGKERSIMVFLPENYTDNMSEDSCAVAYVLDGHYEAFLNMITYPIDYLTQNLEIPNMIVVGIIHDDRQNELTPNENINVPSLLTRHLTEEVFPLIDQTYRSNKYRIGIGHSRAGLYLFNQAFTEAQTFNASVAISPVIGYLDGLVLDRAKDFIEKTKEINSYFFASMGSEEEDMVKSFEKIFPLMEKAQKKGLVYITRNYENRGHWGTPVSSVNDGLIELQNQLSISSEDRESLLVEVHVLIADNLKYLYEKKSSWAGIELIPSVEEINDFGYQALSSNRMMEAEEVFKYAIELYPSDPNLHDSYGESLEKNDKIKEANSAYRKALKILEERKNEVSENHYNNLKGIFEENITRTD